MWQTPAWGTIFRCQKLCETIITVTFSKNLTPYDTQQGKHYFCKHTFHSFYWCQSSTSITFIVSTFSDSKKKKHPGSQTVAFKSYINNVSSTYTVTWYLLQPPKHPKMLLKGNIVNVSHLSFFFFLLPMAKPKCHHLTSWESGAALESSNIQPRRSCCCVVAEGPMFSLLCVCE